MLISVQADTAEPPIHTAGFSWMKRTVVKLKMTQP